MGGKSALISCCICPNLFLSQGLSRGYYVAMQICILVKQGSLWSTFPRTVPLMVEEPRLYLVRGNAISLGNTGSWLKLATVFQLQARGSLLPLDKWNNGQKLVLSKQYEVHPQFPSSNRKVSPGFLQRPDGTQPNHHNLKLLYKKVQNQTFIHSLIH